MEHRRDITFSCTAKEEEALYGLLWDMRRKEEEESRRNSCKEVMQASIEYCLSNIGYTETKELLRSVRYNLREIASASGIEDEDTEE